MKLIVNSEELDLITKDVKLSVSIKDSREPDKIRTGKSDRIILADSYPNRKALEFVGDYMVDAPQTHDAYIESGAIQAYGKLIVDRIKSGASKGISSQFLTNNYSWIDLVKTKKVNELSISSLTHLLTKANIDNSAAGTKDYCYPIVDYRHFQLFNGVPNIQIVDLFPAVKVKTILENIFSEAGYAITGTYISSAEFEKLYMLFGGSHKIVDEMTAKDLGISVGLTERLTWLQMIPTGVTTYSVLLFAGNTADHTNIDFDNDDDSDLDFYDNGDHFDSVTSHKFTVPADSAAISFEANVDAFGFYHDLDHDPDHWSLTCRVSIYKDDGSETEIMYDQQTIVMDARKYNFYIRTRALYLSAGTKVYVKVKVSGTVDGSSIKDRGLYFHIDYESMFKNYPLQRRGVDYPYTSEEMLPDITQINFIKGIAHLFNLLIYTDDINKLVRIEKETDFYQETGQDFREYQTDVCDIKRNEIFEYRYLMKDDSRDAFLVEHKNIYGEKNLYEFIPDNQNNPDVKEIRNKVFAPVIFRKPYLLENVSIDVPVMWTDITPDEDYTPDYDFDLRILRHSGTVTDASIKWDFGTGMTHPIMLEDFIDFQADYLFTNLELNENFSLEVEMYLPKIVMSNFISQSENKNLRNPIYVDHVKYAGWYWVEEIKNYKSESGKCRVKLIKTRKTSTL